MLLKIVEVDLIGGEFKKPTIAKINGFSITLGLMLVTKALKVDDRMTLRIIMTRIREKTIKNRLELASMIETLNDTEIRKKLKKESEYLIF